MHRHAWQPAPAQPRPARQRTVSGARPAGQAAGRLLSNGLSTPAASCPLHAIPPLLREAFVTAEDTRFFTHHGTDWRARFSAIKQNLLAAARRFAGPAPSPNRWCASCIRVCAPSSRAGWKDLKRRCWNGASARARFLPFTLTRCPTPPTGAGWRRRRAFTSTAMLIPSATRKCLPLPCCPAPLPRWISTATRGVIEQGRCPAGAGDGGAPGQLPAQELPALQAQPLRLEPPGPLSHRQPLYRLYP